MSFFRPLVLVVYADEIYLIFFPLNLLRKLFWSVGVLLWLFFFSFLTRERFYLYLL